MASVFSRNIARMGARFYATNTRPVVHTPANKRFEVNFPDGETAYLSYEKVGSDFDLQHTIVPESKRGQGLAEQLATAAFAFVKESKAKAIPTCDYLSKTFLKRNAQWKEVVKE